MAIRHVVAAGSLIGREAINSDGENLGRIEDVMLDTKEGRIAYVILRFQGSHGKGGKRFLVPYGALEYDRESGMFVTDTDVRRLENAPGFDETELPGAIQNEYGRYVAGKPKRRIFWS